MLASVNYPRALNPERVSRGSGIGQGARAFGALLSLGATAGRAGVRRAMGAEEPRLRSWSYWPSPRRSGTQFTGSDSATRRNLSPTQTRRAARRVVERRWPHRGRSDAAGGSCRRCTLLLLLEHVSPFPARNRRSCFNIARSVVGEFDFVDLLHAAEASASPARRQTWPSMPYCAFEVRRARQNLLLVLENRFGHLHRRGRRRIVSAARLPDASRSPAPPFRVRSTMQVDGRLIHQFSKRNSPLPLVSRTTGTMVSPCPPITTPVTFSTRDLQLCRDECTEAERYPALQPAAELHAVLGELGRPERHLCHPRRGDSYDDDDDAVRRIASLCCSVAPFTTSLFANSRSSRLMPGLRAKPAVMMAISEFAVGT